jgi:hypothetical protein
MVDRSTAERLFESYLSGQGLPWEYEPLFGQWRPDYLIHAASADCVVEVEELRQPDPLPSGGYAPDRAVREALRRGHKQVRGCKHLPAGILIYSESVFRSVTGISVAAAAFGPGYQNALPYDRVGAAAPALRFLTRRECGVYQHLANPFLSRTDNRSISAVMLLTHYRLDMFELAVWQELLRRQERGEQIPPGANIKVAADLEGRAPRTFEFEGTRRVVLIENPYARIPFPHDVFQGPFDQRWTWKEGWCTPTWIGRSATKCRDAGVPFGLL